MVEVALDVVQAHLRAHQELGAGPVRDCVAAAAAVAAAAVPAAAAAVAAAGVGRLQRDGDALHWRQGQLAEVADQEADAEGVALK